MKLFTDLYLEIDRTTRTAEKVAAMVRYFRAAPPRDAAWAIFVLSGRKIGKALPSRLLRQWAGEASGYPTWLVDQCYSVVGDLSETLSLLVPHPSDGQSPPRLHEIIEERLRLVGQMTAVAQRQMIKSTWAELSTEQRMIFHKLLSGNFRVGVSKQLLIRAIAEVAGLEPAIIAHRLSGSWLPDASTMPRLLAAHDADAPPGPSVPYPFMLANPLLEPPESLGETDPWFIEWKWDGIRAQLLRRSGRITLWSRGDESVGNTFPEIVQVATALPDGTVLDGEIVAWNDELNRPMPFTKLQRRLNRQTVELTFWPEVPVTFIAFDILEVKGRDVREEPLDARRELLAACVAGFGAVPTLRLSTPVSCHDWKEVQAQMQDARRLGVEGVMLKRRDSPYRPGRPAGLWWKWKVQPFTMDAVLIAAEPGRGRRAGLLTDYTFGVWDEGKLVPVAKAYSGLTDEEIAEVDRFARRHTVGRHGPVHVVEPTKVFEIGFEAIQPSTRHKSGIGVRFPRILRMRKDKQASEADQLETLRQLLHRVETLQ